MVIILGKLKNQLCFADAVLIISSLIIGAFNEFASCIISLILSVYLLVKIFRSKQLDIKINISGISLVLICFMYGLSCLWAIDSGMAFIGFLKFLPILLFLLTVWQSKTINFETWLPYFASGMVLISTIGMHIPYISQFFTVAERLAGFFQYPNTFALFLLVSELVLFKKQKFKIPDFICIAILIFGLLYTGSRTVFLISIAANLAMAVYRFKKAFKTKAFLISAAVFIVACAGIFLIILSASPDVLKRYLSISFTESTFVGRILYWVDALPLLLKYPFGMGYLGYSYMQGSIQTGWYSIRYVHNDFLQLALDIGVIPTALFMFAIIKNIFYKGTPFYKKVAIVSICAHSFFDFDLQFIAVFFLLILLLDNENGKTITIKKNTVILRSILILLAALNLYMGSHLVLAYFEQNNAAETLYPFNTDVKISSLETQSDLEIANSTADEILKQNTSSFIPYSVKAKYYYSIGDFNSLIQTKRMVFELNPYEYTEYEEYCQMLINGISFYQKLGDNASIKYCQQELINTKKTLEQNINSLSPLGKKIKDQPTAELPDEILYYITQIEKE